MEFSLQAAPRPGRLKPELQTRESECSTGRDPVGHPPDKPRSRYFFCIPDIFCESPAANFS